MKKRKIKVAMVAPPFGDTGGPEVVVQNLTDALLKKGIDVTLFAPGDWKTRAKHIPTLKKSIWDMSDFKKQTDTERNNLIIYSQLEVLKWQNRFDVVHLHSMKYAYAVSKSLTVPVVLTTHNSMLDRTRNFFRSANINLVAISDYNKRRNGLSEVVHNGLPVRKIPYSLVNKNNYLITIGRIANEKGIHESIKIARKARKKLIIIGRTGLSSKRISYFEKKVKPYIDGKNIIHINKVSRKEIYEYLKNASALLFTPLWQEPFGLVAVESLATGTPIIGYKSGALPEIIKNNKKIGYLSSNINNLVRAIKDIKKFDRTECRRHVEKYFDSSVMAEKYINLYEKVIKKHKK